MPNTLRVTIST